MDFLLVSMYTGKVGSWCVRVETASVLGLLG